MPLLKVLRVSIVSIVSLLLTACNGDSSQANKAPIARANGPYAGIQGIAISFSSAGSMDPDGVISSYKWDFANGETSNSENPAHSFSKAGRYLVTLTVTDNDNVTDHATAAVTVAPSNTNHSGAPTARINAPDSGTTGILISFTSSGSSAPNGTIESYRWDFGDGDNSTEQNPSHVYRTANTYNVTLIVTDNEGVSSAPTTKTISISQPANIDPVAVANGPYTGIANQSISFSSSGSHDTDGNIVSYHWDFGDGNTSTEANPLHRYTVAGSYYVDLTVTDNQGASSTTSSTNAIINNPVNKFPKANVNGPYAGATGVPVNFTSAGSSDADGIITSYIWSFGDGDTSTDPNPSHSYTSPGIYPVSLTVLDNKGSMSEASATTVTVSDVVNSDTPDIQ